MIIVCGSQRSGTSALMSAIRKMGIPTVGYKYPVMLQTNDGNMVDGGSEEPLNGDQTRFANPTGLWEVTTVCRGGLKYNIDGEVIKTISTTLPMSDPSCIDRCVYIIRDPRRAVISQKNLHPEAHELDVAILIWFYDNLKALHWLLNYHKTFKIVIYDELLSDPERVLTDIVGFINLGGNVQRGVQQINANLNRTAPSTEGDFRLADDLYETMVKRDIDKLSKYNLKAVGDILREKYYASQKEANVKA